jgi:hypothetical protein
MGVGNARDRIGHAGASGNHGHAQSACELAMSLGHMHGGTLVAHIDDPDSQLGGMIPDRHDMTTAETEYAIHTSLCKESCDEMGYFLGI